MTIADLNVRVAFLNDLRKGLGNMEKDLRRAQRNLSSAGNEISMALSLPLAAFGAKAVQTAAQMEGLKLAMRTTFQDAGRSIQEADKELEALRKSAMAPGLDFEQAVKASIRLQNVGMNAEGARHTIEQLANTISMAGGTAEDLDGVTIQMAQMISKGKVLASDLRIIQERMPKITSLMQEAFGVKTADQLQEMGVSGEEFVTKITAAMQKLPRVSGGLANSIVNVGASIKAFLADIGDDIAETFDLQNKFEKFGTWLQELAAWFKGLSAGTKEWVLKIGAAVVALGPLLKVMGAVSAMSAQVVGFIGSMVNVTKNMIGAAFNAVKAFQALSLAQKATVIGLAIAAISTFVIVLGKMGEGLTAAARQQNMLNSVQLSAAQSIVEERLAAERNISVIRDETKSKEEKQAALKDLIAVGGDYFKGLDIEKSSIDKINAAYDGYIANLIASAKLKAGEEKIIELEKRRLAITEAMGKAQEKGNNRLLAETFAGVVTSTTSMGFQQLGAMKAELKEIEAQQKELARVNADISKTQPSAKTTTGSLFNVSGDNATSTKKQGKGIETVSSVLTKLTADFNAADTKAAALGSTFDVQAERAGLLRDSIEKLLSMGISPTDAALQPLIERYQALNTELGILPQKFEGITSTSTPLLETTTQLTAMANTVSVAWVALGDTMESALQSAGQAMMDYAAAGGASLKKMGQEALKAAANVVRGALMSFVANVIKDTGIASGPLAAFVAPAAGAAAGVAFNSILKGLKVPAFAKEGMVQEPTLAMFGEYPGAKQNPEYALKENRLQGLLNKAATTGGAGQRLSGVLYGDGRSIYATVEAIDSETIRTRGYSKLGRG